MPKFTKTEEKILTILADGKRHVTRDVRAEVMNGDEYENMAVAFQMHMSRIRKKLNPIGQDIICQYHGGKMHYIHVRLIGTSE